MLAQEMMHRMCEFLPKAHICYPAPGFLACWSALTSLSYKPPKQSDLRQARWIFAHAGQKELHGSERAEHVDVQVTPTDTIIISGRFQTLPIAIYGWVLPQTLSQVSCKLTLSAWAFG